MPPPLTVNAPKTFVEPNAALNVLAPVPVTVRARGVRTSSLSTVLFNVMLVPVRTISCPRTRISL